MMNKGATPVRQGSRSELSSCSSSEIARLSESRVGKYPRSSDLQNHDGSHENVTVVPIQRLIK